MGWSTETVGTWIACLLTLMVFSFLGREIPFLRVIYRTAAYLFVGVTLGYGAVVAWHSVLVPRLLSRLDSGEWWYLVPLVLCLFLLARVNPSWRPVSRLTLAFMFGVGAALAVGGAVVGTLFPQVRATSLSLNPAHYEAAAASEGNLTITYVLNAFLVVVGTIGALSYFYFTTGSRSAQSRWSAFRERAVHLASGFGKVFIMFTFGALFATSAITFVSLLIDRVRFVVDTIWSAIPIP